MLLVPAWWEEVIRTISGVGRLWCESSPTLIEGFLWRQDSELLLQSCEVGTFLLRFSDKHPGWLTVSMNLADHRSHGGCKTSHVLIEPRDGGFVIRIEDASRSCLRYESLSDLVYNMRPLVWLHPRVPKEVAFSLR